VLPIAVDFGLIFFIAAFIFVPSAFVFILLWNRIKPRERLAQKAGLDVDAPRKEVRRGEDVEVLVTVPSARGLGDVQAGVVCTERYDETDTDTQGRTTRTTSQATAHETWIPVARGTGTQSVNLAIPPEAPFSYDGGCLSFEWEVAARMHRSLRLDAEVRRHISVLP
jgi:hypothetical protein